MKVLIDWRQGTVAIEGEGRIELMQDRAIVDSVELDSPLELAAPPSFEEMPEPLEPSRMSTSPRSAASRSNGKRG